jgi:hypothetical protein
LFTGHAQLDRSIGLRKRLRVELIAD